MGTMCGVPWVSAVASRATRAEEMRCRISVASIERSIVDAVQRLRTYTVDEANRELPRVRPIVEQISELSALLPELEDHARIAEYQSKRKTGGAEDRERHQQARNAVSGAELELLKAVASLNGM